MEIKAFKALRFNSKVVGDTGNCISPPYDVIDPDQQDQLYQLNDHNMARIIKGKTSDSDTPENNQYTRAAEYLNKWVASNALKADETPAIYAYVQNFNVGDDSFCRSGFVATGKLVEFGEAVKPHEKTLDGPKADRLNLMRACKAQFGQIFMLYNDPQKIADAIIDKASQGGAVIDFVDDMDVRHRLFIIDAQDDIDAVTAMMADKDAVIADGHHRYETALNYYKETKNPAAEYRMMTFVNVHNEGLLVLPTHRLVGNLENFTAADLLEKLSADFEITEFSLDQKDAMFKAMKAAFDKRLIAFGLYAKDGKFYCLVLNNAEKMNEIAPGLSDVSKSLDVSVLHLLILDSILGIGEKQLASQSNIKYIKDIGDAIDNSIAAVDSGDKQLVFFMNSTRMDQIQDVAAAGEKMPQKSTFFYPKIFTGLTINKL